MTDPTRQSVDHRDRRKCRAKQASLLAACDQALAKLGITQTPTAAMLHDVRVAGLRRDAAIQEANRRHSLDVIAAVDRFDTDNALMQEKET